MYMKTTTFSSFEMFVFDTFSKAQQVCVFLSWTGCRLIFVFAILFSFTNQAVSSTGSNSVTGTRKSSVLRLHCCPQ